jgi:site-specific DNA recombinase
MRVIAEETEGLRVALYARFSSDLQRDRSIEDQFTELERAVKRFGFKTDKRHYYADRSQSASTLFERTELTDLMGAAKRGEFDAVLVEATDRLSRRRADTFWLADRFEFYKVKLFTPMGLVNDLQLTFEGHANEDFLKKLAMRVKRGHNSMTREGRFAGGRCYGYDQEPATGKRTINEEQAKIVRRIFAEYANGISPRKICAGLERDGIPSLTGKKIWNKQGILGGDGTGTGEGLLHRDLYRGKIIRNRFAKIKNPDNGRYVNRKGDPDELIEVDAPHLRIVSDELWNAAHAMRNQRRTQYNPSGVKAKPTLGRKEHLLSGLLKCASCMGQMTAITHNRTGCSNAAHRKTCDHTKTYNLDVFTEEVIQKVNKELTDPEFLKRRVRAKALEMAKAEKEEGAERDATQRRHDRVTLEIARLVDALADPDMPRDQIKEKLKGKEAERVALVEKLKLLGKVSNVRTLPDATMSAFGKSIETLVTLLRNNPDDDGLRHAFGNIINSVLVHPTPKKRPYELSLYARVSAIGKVNLFPPVRSHEKIVAEEGVSKLSCIGKIETSI